jgi:signal transduction histidine kinase
MMMPLGALLVLLGGMGVGYLLFKAPQEWAERAILEQEQEWSDRHWLAMLEIENHWQNLPPAPKFLTGDEPEIRKHLASQPLMVAHLDRREPDRLWVRDGGRFRLAPSSDRMAPVYRQWMALAAEASDQHWNPPKSLDPDFGKIASVVLLGDERTIIKRWRPGSPDVEQALQVALGAKPSMRMGLVRTENSTNFDSRKKESWGAEPHLQADAARLLPCIVRLATKSTAFGEGWDPIGIPFEPQIRSYWRFYRTHLWTARGVAALVALSMLGGFWIRHRVRQRAILDADRLASLTHSLKTPLAILKFRCDSLRLGRLGPDESEAELMKLGSEVDDLTHLIENGLRAIRGVDLNSPEGEVSAAWIAEVVDDLQPVFEAERRSVDLRLSPDTGQASLTSLRSALQTLIENALFHGTGTVSIETWRSRNRFLIRVCDEGEGLNTAQLEALGKPFLRIRSEGGEGFKREGQGLGLSLLFQVAEREGWGLAFSSSSGRGLMASLEIRAI